jgi:predicted acyltransferase
MDDHLPAASAPARLRSVDVSRGMTMVGMILVNNPGWFFPINKPIWTSSYAVFTAGLAFSTLALCYWWVDLRGERRLTRFFVIYGVNAIAVYVGSGALARTLTLVEVGGVPLKQVIYGALLASWLPPQVASLAYAVTWVVGWFVVLAWMYRRKIFITI